MQPQRFQFGDQSWPEDTGVLQVYAPISLELNPELAELIGKCRAAASGAPVSEVDDRFLHTTIVIYSCQANPPVNRLSGCQAR